MFSKSFGVAAIVSLALIGHGHAQQQPSPVQPAPVKCIPLQKLEVPGTA